ncbi:metallophosphoesterase family protein [Oceanicella sp. SM1341]|uniref:metallophosphoesterase family protein n=1 Tax=Oceanicella sp. SM1341 TaxID=1548889 RepID=UPI000E4CA9B1|nr:metallophosphoesterase family protein [Oceanicella sp. SM1341]
MNTDGRRIYAIGDVHGCREALARRHAQIRDDLAKNPTERDALLVHLGDYVDRGPDSRGVVEDLMSFEMPGVEMHCIKGNHDHMLLRFLAAPEEMHCPYHYLTPNVGGPKTLASYGVGEGRMMDVHAAALAAVPQAHRDFLATRPLTLRAGSYLFVHAGIRPGVPLAEQEEQDLIWIRAPFLDSTDNHGFVVVHGHTPVDDIEVHQNRIAVDTGAVFGNRLSCLVLEGDELWLLDEWGRQPLTPP